MDGSHQRYNAVDLPVKEIESGAAVSRLGASALAGEFVSAQSAARDSAEPPRAKAKAVTPAAKTSHFPSRIRRRVNTSTSLRAARRSSGDSRGQDQG